MGDADVAYCVCCGGHSVLLGARVNGDEMRQNMAQARMISGDGLPGLAIGCLCLRGAGQGTVDSGCGEDFDSFARKKGSD